MITVLLCAGYGTRLYPLTKDRAKPLLPVGGRPILNHLLDRVKELAGLEKVYVVTNERFLPQFQEWAAKEAGSVKPEVTSDGTHREEERLGAIGDLAFVIQKFQLTQDVAVFAGDNLFCFSLQEFASFAVSHRPHVSLGVVDVEDSNLARQYGIVKLSPSGQVLEFLEKPNQPPSTLASTGIYWIPEERIEFLDRYVRGGHNADRLGDFMAWLAKTDGLFAYRFAGNWLDIGDLDSYRKADRLLSKS